MFTVALIGPDGAGKSTIGRRLQASVGLPIKYVYMGINLEASNVMLPTTRLALAFKRSGGGQLAMGGPPDPDRVKAPPKGLLKRLATEVKSGLRMLFLLAEEWYRQLVIEYYQLRGDIVLVDRHFVFDYYYHDIVQSKGYRPLSSRVHGFMLKNLYPRPDLVICLDAPAMVLYERKHEGSVAAIEKRRQEYLQLANLVANFVVVDVTQPENVVAEQVTALVQDFYAARSGSLQRVQNG
jgi:thymidylate kinase